MRAFLSSLIHAAGESVASLHGHSLRYWARLLIRCIIISAIMLPVCSLLDHGRDSVHNFMAAAQKNSYAAIASINPIDIADRYVCALTPSVERMNRIVPRVELMKRVSSDCAYTLAKKAATLGASTAERTDTEIGLPPPVVGHWADGDQGFIALPDAFLDTAWHYIDQPSIVASILSISVFVLGSVLAVFFANLMRIPPSPVLSPMAFGILGFIGACIVAACLQTVMVVGNHLLHWLTPLAPLALAASTAAAGLTPLLWKTIETAAHMVVDHLVPETR